MVELRLESAAETAVGDPILAELEGRVLWLATAMVHHANRLRPNSSGVKVGGHQASSASLVTIMTSLWFRHLTAEDRVSVKPHASPVLHAINYLLGELDPRYLTQLRALGGLQSYPSRSKDPDPVDYSTGSVGIGATATVWGSLARRYVERDRTSGTRGRQYALLGDAELDEGAIWEALLDPQVRELGELVWIVDLNRQSLDRVVPNIAVDRLIGMFAALGWQVLTLKYGAVLEELFTRPGGHALRRRIDEMANPEYQRLLRCTAAELRGRLPGEGANAAVIAHLIGQLTDDELVAALRNLGGHDLRAIDDVFAMIDDYRPTVVFAYTVKGHRLPVQGHPQNHSALLSDAQIEDLAVSLGVRPDGWWDRPAEGSAADRLCREAHARLTRQPTPTPTDVTVPTDFGHEPSGRVSTQAALGRTLLDLTRRAPDVASRIVTVSPDVSSSTNLGGWVNKVGVWSTQERTDWFADDDETLLHWRERPSGQHVELGIAETNLVGLLGELGATWSRWGSPLYPIGVLYDPFVERALEPWSFGMYAGGQSILVGTPSGVTLAPEGGAHQSVKTPSIGLEQPGCTAYEPAFAVDLEWALLESLRHLGRPGGRSSYLRLSSRPIDQSLAAIPEDPALRERRRRQSVAGGYRLVTRPGVQVTLVAMGAVVPEALLAAKRLGDANVICDVVVVTSPGLLFEAMLARRGMGSTDTWILDQLFPPGALTPLVTVLDGHPHALAFLAGLTARASAVLGVTDFGQSGDLQEVYRHHGIDADALVRAAFDVLGR